MSPYGLRQSPKPSKRMLEASEQSNAPINGVKRRRIKAEGSKELEAHPEKIIGNQDAVGCSESQLQTEAKATESGERPLEGKQRAVPTKAAKQRETTSEQVATSKVANVVKKSKIVTKQPTSTKRAKVAKKSKIGPKLASASKHLPVIKKSDGRKKTRKTEDIYGVLENSNDSQHRPTAISSSSSSNILAQADPPKTSTQSETKKKTTKRVDTTLLHTEAASQGPQLTPDGKGIDLSPDTLPSAETPHTPYAPDPDDCTSKENLEIVQKKSDGGSPVTNYSPFDIVSGGRPPDLSKTEKEFWVERKGDTFVQEELPDRYGRLWKCVKMVGKDFPRDVEWHRGTTRDKDSDDVGPGSAAEIFEREVDLFLSAFGEELPEWSVLEDVDKLDFGEG